MKLQHFLIAGSLGVVLLAVISHDPVPDICKPTAMVHITLRIMKFISFLCKCLGYFGWCEPVMYRELISAFVNSSPIVPDPEVNVTNMVMGGVPVRLYQPVTTKGLKRGIVYFHGGGWTFGDLDMYETMLLRISKHLDAVTVSVDYSLGPEKPFPQAVYDAEEATKYFIDRSENFQVDRKRIGLMGDSAGGTLATVISRRLRDANFAPLPRLQIMIYPVTQALDLDTPSYTGNQDGPFLTKANMIMYLSVYLFGEDYNKYLYDMVNNQHVVVEDSELRPLLKFIDVARLPVDSLRDSFVPRAVSGKRDVWEKVKSKLLDPDFSPLFTQNLSGLPHTYVSTCQYDVLRDDGFFYVHRLKEAGVRVEHDHSMMCYHGWIWHRNYVDAFDKLYAQMLQYIDKNL